MQAFNLLDNRFADRNSYSDLFRELSQLDLNELLVLSHYSKDRLPRTKNKPILFLLDEVNRGDQWKLLDYAKIIFKQYAPLRPENRIIPLPFTKNIQTSEYVKISERSIDYCILGPHNRIINAQITSYYDKINQNGYIRNRYGIDDNEILAQTKICICPPGPYSTENFRYNEAAAAGCIIICPRKLPFWYYSNKYEFCVPDWNLLSELLERILLLSPYELNLIGESTVQYYENYLSPKGVALHIKKFIEEFNC